MGGIGNRLKSIHLNRNREENTTMIKILLFAHLQEEIGKDALLMDTESCTVQQVKHYIHTQYPNVNLNQVMAAVNEDFSFDEDIVKDGDVIAFLPPVSGG